MSYIPQLMSGRSLLHNGVNEKQWVSRGSDTYVELFEDFHGVAGALSSYHSGFAYSEAGTSTACSGLLIDAADGVVRLLHTTASNTTEACLLSASASSPIAAKDSDGNSNEVVLEVRAKITLSTDTAFDASSIYSVYIGLWRPTAVTASATLVDGLDDNAAFLLGGISGTNSIYCETDDVTTNNDDKDSGIDFTSGTYHVYKIDMTDLTNVRFFVDGVDANNGNTFDMSGIGATDYLEPFVLFSRTDTGGTERAHSMDIDYIKCTWKRS
jgi:hypothetical protein